MFMLHNSSNGSTCPVTNLQYRAVRKGEWLKCVSARAHFYLSVTIPHQVNSFCFSYLIQQESDVLIPWWNCPTMEALGRHARSGCIDFLVRREWARHTQDEDTNHELQTWLSGNSKSGACSVSVCPYSREGMHRSKPDSHELVDDSFGCPRFLPWRSFHNPLNTISLEEVSKFPEPSSQTLVHFGGSVDPRLPDPSHGISVQQQVAKYRIWPYETFAAEQWFHRQYYTSWVSIKLRLSK